MPKNILFFPDVYREHGHWLPVVALAQKLKAYPEINIAFMGIADCKPIVEPYGLEFHEVFKKEYPQSSTKLCQYQAISERREYAAFWSIAEGSLDELMENYKPDLIVSGYFTSFETLLMYYKYGKKYDTRFMFTTTFLRHPTAVPEADAIQKLANMPEPILRKIMGAVCEDSIDVDKATIYDLTNPLKNITELVLCPREFEFDDYRFDSDIDEGNGRVKFIEPCIVSHYNTNNTWKEDIPLEKVENNKIIFVTAGSRVQDYKDKARLCFREIIKMMNLPVMPNYHLVISAGPVLAGEDWARQEILPKNVSVFSWVPQLDVLNHCTAAYIHGGLATIKECIYKNVPMIVMPLGKDQMDNSLRVRHYGIGLVANTEPCDYNALQYLFVKAIADSRTIKNLKKMSDSFVTKEESRPGVQLILNEFQRA